MNKTIPLLITLASILGACSGGSDNNSTTVLADDSGVATPLNAAPDIGDITAFGVISVGEEDSVVTDLLAAFFVLDRGVSSDYFEDLFSTATINCTVENDDLIDFEEISVGYIPSVNGVSQRTVSAGTNVMLSAQGNTFADMPKQPASGFIFYDLATNDMVNIAPDGLVANVTGDAEFPAFSNVAFNSVEPLLQASYGDSNITPDTQFSWTPGSISGSKIRIFSQTAGGFFLENGLTVTCLVPDNGTFSFPAATRQALGVGFKGGPPLMSRLSVGTARSNSALLYTIHESFAR